MCLKDIIFQVLRVKEDKEVTNRDKLKETWSEQTEWDALKLQSQQNWLFSINKGRNQDNKQISVDCSLRIQILSIKTKFLESKQYWVTISHTQINRWIKTKSAYSHINCTNKITYPVISLLNSQPYPFELRLR